ncbi:MAG: O-antigen ligase family protein [Spirochaetes bacterium]|nr:O-antigen ligase family protein [Spirochaetota bacterium]
MFFQPAAVFPQLAPYQPVKNTAIMALLTYILGGKKSKIPFFSVLTNRYFLLFMLMQTIGSFLVWSQAGMETVNFWMRYGIVYFLLFKSINDEKKVKSVIMLIILALGYLSYYSISTFVVDYMPGARAAGFGWYENGNDLSIILVSIIPLVLLLSNTAKNTALKYLFLILSGIISFNILFTGSRSGLLALFCVGVFSLITAEKIAKPLRTILLVSLLLGIMIIGTATVLSRRDIETGMLGDVSSENRKVQWKAGIKMTLRNPFFGVGRDKFIENAEYYGGIRGMAPHNTIIQVFAESGIPGGIFFFLFAIYPIIDGRKIMKKIDKEKLKTEKFMIYRFLLYSLTGFWICAFFSNRYHSYMLYVLVALITAVKENLLSKDLIEVKRTQNVN